MGALMGDGAPPVRSIVASAKASLYPKRGVGCLAQWHEGDRFYGDRIFSLTVQSPLSGQGHTRVRTRPAPAMDPRAGPGPGL